MVKYSHGYLGLNESQYGFIDACRESETSVNAEGAVRPRRHCPTVPTALVSATVLGGELTTVLRDDSRRFVRTSVRAGSAGGQRFGEEPVEGLAEVWVQVQGGWGSAGLCLPRSGSHTLWCGSPGLSSGAGFQGPCGPVWLCCHLDTWLPRSPPPGRERKGVTGALPCPSPGVTQVTAARTPLVTRPPAPGRESGRWRETAGGIC